MPLPIRLFEISDVILRDNKNEVGARNERHLCIVIYNKTVMLDYVHGKLNKIMHVLEVPWHSNKDNEGYHLRSIEGLYCINFLSLRFKVYCNFVLLKNY